MASLKLPKKRKLPANDVDTARNEASDEASDLQLKPGFLDDLELVTRTVGPLTAEELADEETEVWLLQCPNDVPLESLLLGKKVKLNGTTTFGDDDTPQYETLSVPLVAKPAEPLRSITAVTPTRDGEMRLVSAPIKGHILLRERLEDCPAPVILSESRTPHTLPPNLKARHSIYGADYEEVLEARGIRLPGRKKKKKRRNEREDAQVPEVVDLEDGIPSEEDSRTKRKSKKKQTEDEISYAVPIIEVHEEIVTKKKKHRHLNGYDEISMLNGDMNMEVTAEAEVEAKLSKSQEKARLKEKSGESVSNRRINEEEVIKRKSRKSKVVD